MNALKKQFRAPAAQPDISGTIGEADIPALVRTFTQWRAQKPDVEKTAHDIAARFDFAPHWKNMIHAAAKLAAEPNENAYHDNVHYLEVFTTTSMLGVRALEKGRISKSELALLLTAALIHDYKHDGIGNMGEQYRLEKRAVDSAEPFLTAAGAQPRDMALIRAMVYATDVGKNFADPDAVSPAESIKFVGRGGKIENLKPELKILHDYGMIDTALMLTDADIASSLISAKLARHSGQLLAEEFKKPYDPKSMLFFLDQICHRRAFSQAGQEIIQPHLDNMLKEIGPVLADSPALIKT